MRHNLTELHRYQEKKSECENVPEEQEKTAGREMKSDYELSGMEDSESAEVDCMITGDDVMCLESRILDFMTKLNQDLQQPAVVLDSFRSRLYRDLVSFSEELCIGLLALIAYNTQYGEADALSDESDAEIGSWTDCIFMRPEDLPF